MLEVLSSIPRGKGGREGGRKGGRKKGKKEGRGTYREIIFPEWQTKDLQRSLFHTSNKYADKS
jgi:hypothetical protein